MGGLIGNGVKQAKPVTYTCVQIQTSALGLPIPILWGTNRLSGNCIDAFNFQDNGNKGSKGGKGGKGSDDYSASVMIALCEGRADNAAMGVGRVWQGGSEIGIDALGGFVSPGTGDQSVWSEAANVGHNLAYPFVCYYANADLDLGSAATIPQISFELFGTFNNYNVPNIPDAMFGDIIPDFLCNPRYTLNMDPALLAGFNEGGLTGSNTSLLVYHYCQGIYVSPILKDAEQVSSTLQRWSAISNAWFFWSGTQLKCVCLGDTPLTAVGPHGENVQYIPNLNAVYALGPDDFVVADKNDDKAEPPVTVNRKDPADGFNQVQLNCSIRYTNDGANNGAAYQDTPYRWQDDSSIYHVGVQAPNVVSSSEICQDSVAATVVSLIGQRAMYIRNEYSFKLLYNFLLLEPGDIVTLTEPNIGLVAVPVRIKQVDEDDKGNLSFVAEEFAAGLGTANGQDYEQSGGAALWNLYADPGPINPPAFWQPPTSLTGGVLELWIALSGGPNVGGCGVFISFDDVTYSQIGECTTPSLQGTLTSALPLVAGLDTTSTLAIDLTESSGIIPATATEADAQAYRTLCMVDNELLAYGNVTPTGDYAADLTYLERGLYGTAPAAHAAGAPFSRIDPAKVFSYPLPEGYFGQELYFEFPTVNLFGNSAQTLADCVAYPTTPSAPLPGANPASVSAVLGSSGSGDATVSWPAATGTPLPTLYQITLYQDTGVGITTPVLISTTIVPYYTLSQALTGMTSGDQYTAYVASGNSYGFLTADVPSVTFTAP